MHVKNENKIFLTLNLNNFNTKVVPEMLHTPIDVNLIGLSKNVFFQASKPYATAKNTTFLTIFS